MHTRWRRLAPALAVASGVLLVVAHEPIAVGPVGWVALIPLYLAVLSDRARMAVVYGALCGAVFFGVHLWWIFLFGWMAWTGLTVALTLYVVAAASLGGLLSRFPAAPVLVAGSWAGMELLRDSWPWGGFPWGALGTTQAGVPGVSWLAGVVGVYGLSFLLAFAAAAVAHRILTGGVPWRSIALVGSVLAAFVAVDLLRYGAPPEADTMRVAVVQGSAPRPVAIDQDRQVFDSHLELTEDLDRGSLPDLIVWPEDAIGSRAGGAALAQTAELSGRLGVPMLVGRTEVRPADGEFVNVVDHLDGSGRAVQTYEKRHPVPFGEFVPVPALRRFVTTLDQIPYDMARGDHPTVFEVNGIPVATPICFESVFPRDVRVFSRQGAELIIVSTNNASFERSPASRQHLAHARMRALENRQWVIQAALSGISAAVAPDGSVSGETGLFDRRVLHVEVGVRKASSLYSRVGDVFAYGWAAGAAIALTAYPWRRRWAPGIRSDDDTPAKTTPPARSSRLA